MVRTDRHQLPPVAEDSDLAEAIKVVARAHKTLLWEGTRELVDATLGCVALPVQHRVEGWWPPALGPST
jgi:hypothetical protein